MLYTGSCHCGKVRFEVEGEIDGACACNCSMCARKGSLLWFVPRDALRLQTPDEDIATYLFNKHVIRHRFCPSCGIHPFAEGTDPKGNAMAAVNLRCVGVVPRDCLQVRTAPNEPWQLWHGGIEGFDYRPGDAYLLEIAAYRTPNPPADGSSVRWVLERVVRRQPRQARRRAAQRETNTRAMRKRHMRNA